MAFIIVNMEVQMYELVKYRFCKSHYFEKILIFAGVYF